MNTAPVTLNPKAIAVIVAIVVVGGAGVGGALAGVGPMGGLGGSFAAEEDPAPAPQTAVRLGPTDATVEVGETATYEVIVANASAGVGDHAAVISVGDPSVASITDVSPRGNQSGEGAGVSIAADGSSASLTAGPMDAAENGSVVVATVTVSADAAGTTDVGLGVDGLATSAGDSYDVTDASGASLTAEPKPDPAEFRISGLQAPQNVTAGEPFNVSVSVTNDGDLAATQTVRYELDRDGNGTLDDGTAATREVTLAGHDRETVTFTGINATDLAGGPHLHAAFTETDFVTGTLRVEAVAASTEAPETVVRLLPSDAAADGSVDPDGTVDAGEYTTYDVVVDNASGGVGAQDVRVDVEDPTHATIRSVDVSGVSSDATTDVALIDDGHAANVTAVLMDTDDDGRVTIATLRVRGHALGTTDFTLRVDALGTENGTAYNVTATTGASLTVESSYSRGSSSSGDSGSSDSSDGSGDDADEPTGNASVTRDEITRAKYGVDFADLGSETAGEVQAIYNRQPFADGVDPAEIDTRNEISEAEYGESFDDLDREAVVEVQNAYDAQFGALPTDPAYSLDDIGQAKYGADFADLNAEQTGEALAIYNRQPFPGDTAPGDIRTRDEITNDRYGMDFIDLSRGTTIDIQNDYDAQFGDGET
jgi:hypothetical protein